MGGYLRYRVFHRAVLEFALLLMQQLNTQHACFNLPFIKFQNRSLKYVTVVCRAFLIRLFPCQNLTGCRNKLEIIFPSMIFARQDFECYPSPPSCGLPIHYICCPQGLKVKRILSLYLGINKTEIRLKTKGDRKIKVKSDILFKNSFRYFETKFMMSFFFFYEQVL